MLLLGSIYLFTFASTNTINWLCFDTILTMRKFYNYTAVIYSFGTQEIKGSMVELKVLLYNGIKIAMWKNTKSYRGSTLATQTDSNQYEINLEPQYPVSVWDVVSVIKEVVLKDWNWNPIFDIDGEPITIGESIWMFKIDQVIEHHNRHWNIENIQAFISSTT